MDERMNMASDRLGDVLDNPSGYRSSGARCRSCCMGSRSRRTSHLSVAASGLKSRRLSNRDHRVPDGHGRPKCHSNSWPSLRIHTLPWTLNYVSWTIVALVTLHCLTCTASPVSSSSSSLPSSNPPVISDFSSRHVYTDGHSGGRTMYFRYMTFSGQSLYVGAMEYIYRLNLNDISNQAIRSGNLSQTRDGQTPDSMRRNLQLCQFKNREDKGFLCKNHIRAIIKQGSNLYLCGTAATKPLDIFIDESSMKVMRFGAFNSGKDKCGCDPNMLSTILHLPKNSDLTVYSGTNTNANLDDPVIHRTTLNSDTSNELSTVTDSKWLNEPEFIDSFDAGQYVYFFIRESALENINCGKAIFSRVVRVCKNDQGGGNSVMEKKWTTFLKARLNCSIAGDYPYYFDQLQDVFKLGDKYFGVFTTAQTGIHASAVCAFTNDAITKAFSGTVKEQSNPTSNWLAVPSDRLPPDYKLGSCKNNSREIPDSTLQFTKARPLMDEAVVTDTSQPYLWTSDLRFQRIVVDEISSHRNYKVIFLATDNGEVHKYSLWQDSEGQYQSRLLATWKPFSTQSRVWQMLLKGHMLYMSTDTEVVQVSVRQCQGYTHCTQCVLDPYCGWDEQYGCQMFTSGKAQSVEGNGELSATHVCNAYCSVKVYTHNLRASGEPAHFNCSSKCETSTAVEWYFSRFTTYSQPKVRIVIDNSKYFLTKDNGLIVMSISTEEQTGHYSCEVPTTTGTHVVLARHKLNMLECGSIEQCWKKEFSIWCKKFDQYQEELSHWQCMKNKCTAEGQENCDLYQAKQSCKGG